MKALVYHGPGKKAWEDKPKPALKEPTDAIVKVTGTTICGTDLHILKGDVPTVTDGRILGHEGVGVVEQAGPGVSSFKAGDRVLISCITSDGKCDACKRGMYSHCERGGWRCGRRTCSPAIPSGQRGRSPPSTRRRCCSRGCFPAAVR